MRKKGNSNNRLFFKVFIIFFITILAGADYDMRNNAMSFYNSKYSNKHNYHKSLKRNIPPSTFERKASFIDSLLTTSFKKGKFNGTILIAEKGEIIYSGAFGYSNFKTKDTLSILTPFQLASVTKIFTAAAIMLLYDKGLLNYDDDMTLFLPDFPTKGISIRNLLNHRTGLQNYMYVADKYWDKSKVLTNDDIPELFRKNNIKPIFSANQRFQYCNTNYALLALIVERISGFSFKDFMNNFIFEPLKMKNSYIYCKADDNFVQGSAIGYSYFFKKGIKPEIHDYLDGVTGDKGMYSTVEDLFYFDKALYNNPFVKRETLNQAFEPSPADNNKIKKYGFGWRIRVDDKSRREVYHYGWWRGFKTYFIREMNEQITIISLNNRSNIHMNHLLCQILWYGDKIKNIEEYSEVDDE